MPVSRLPIRGVWVLLRVVCWVSSLGTKDLCSFMEPLTASSHQAVGGWATTIL